MDGICLRPSASHAPPERKRYSKRTGSAATALAGAGARCETVPARLRKPGFSPYCPAPRWGIFFDPDPGRCTAVGRGRSELGASQPAAAIAFDSRHVVSIFLGVASPISAAGSLGSPPTPSVRGSRQFPARLATYISACRLAGLRKEPAAPPGMAAPSDAVTNAKRGPEAAFEVIGIFWIRPKAWLPASPRSRPDSGRHPVRPGTAGASRRRR
ncbi:hypothetical protein RHAB21_01862 [Pseudorhizobium halotolerans]|uniref:Uncharacterized protein n=1 Tax=Pseudorhizobium halotolerans TaxID=1233081 RepID=A0ABN7JI79_9HYPH|nr:hypothetical protein RHAB21_01862 [Pseudorhizobium halotolerans]